ncbi:MAG TPA: methanogenesis marker 17 protein [Methanoregulaceae archaeon]|nr:methanogenesis marker 17 protein [Methanoregulaceae archaeon]
MVLDHFVVESPEEWAVSAYTDIANDVLLDHNLVRAIERLHVAIDPEYPLFIAVGALGRLPPVVHLRDFAEVTFNPGKVRLEISDETHLAALLELLWNRYGRNRVEQPDRWTIEIAEDPDLPVDPDLAGTVVSDPTVGLVRDLIYALLAIAPEGFRVREHHYEKGRFWLAASENTLPDDLEGRVRALFARMEAPA